MAGVLRRKEGKRMKKLRGVVEHRKPYAIQEACELVVKTGSAKFDETVELAVRLGVDAKKSDQGVRGSVSLPHGLGKSIRVAVFAKGEKAEEAKAAGADIVGAEDLAEKIKGGFLDFDALVATPDMMVQVGKVGKLLGPRGLMPSPKVGTVTFDITPIVKALKAGRAEFRSEKAGIIHAPVGKVSFGAQKIAENLAVLVAAINKLRPTASKGVFLEGASISATMGPGIHLDMGTLRNM